VQSPDEHADNCIIRSNRIYQATYQGIYFEGGSTGNLVDCNAIYSNGRSGVFMVDSSGNNCINSNYIN